ncbi:2,3-diphosphoglycerate-dependent phosphoglycerate mutase [Buchnera aphidicola]|uniref:2,3-bisphosphoglycerate-dependent phosphoglycerate mutase n=1 Tax=Buchnera aphidicola (Sarucallis kahawaluokalani) TaxID=1241878 RepID=A0A4D6YI18_9GAMM|nr:2,3-diphosphoglycerate-dependent phosphoglycerate mutase [Buchnera aphidicola]QCI26001.1 2,3-diphosphoglycerate-dependent phosphoglycerate mutase [Buchnera aphidicola (Sarucallis kahawaluokalani)]
MKKNQLILIRHGESTWNKLNQFTGWTDVKLSLQGIKEAISAGKLLKKKNFTFDICYTSVLKRAIHTLWLILYELEQVWLPVKKTWRLNERHYGDLQGLNKESIILKYGADQVQKWRRSFTEIPPRIEKNKHASVYYDRRYDNLEKNNIPVAESIKLTLQRLMPFWEEYIFPNIKSGKKILIVAHGNSLRALIQYLSDLNDQEVFDLHIPTGIPMIYNFSNDQCLKKYSFLKDE